MNREDLAGMILTDMMNRGLAERRGNTGVRWTKFGERSFSTILSPRDYAYDLADALITIYGVSQANDFIQKAGANKKDETDRITANDLTGGVRLD